MFRGKQGNICPNCKLIHAKISRLSQSPSHVSHQHREHPKQNNTQKVKNELLRINAKCSLQHCERKTFCSLAGFSTALKAALSKYRFVIFYVCFSSIIEDHIPLLKRPDLISFTHGLTSDLTSWPHYFLIMYSLLYIRAGLGVAKIIKACRGALGGL